MKPRGLFLIILMSFLGILLVGCDSIFVQPTPTPTETPLPSPTPIPTDTPTPLPTETPTPIPTNTPLPTLPPLPTQPPPTATTAGGKAIYIYFIQKKAGGNVGCGDSLVYYYSGKTRTDDVEYDIKVALQQLFAYHTAEFGDVYNPLYKSQLQVVSVEEGGGQVIIELAGEIKLSDDKCDGSRIWAMLQAVVRQFPGVGTPKFLLNGEGIKNFLK